MYRTVSTQVGLLMYRTVGTRPTLFSRHQMKHTGFKFRKPIDGFSRSGFHSQTSQEPKFTLKDLILVCAISSIIEVTFRGIVNTYKKREDAIVIVVDDDVSSSE